jgi:hypothetical protein
MHERSAGQAAITRFVKPGDTDVDGGRERWRDVLSVGGAGEDTEHRLGRLRRQGVSWQRRGPGLVVTATVDAQDRSDAERTAVQLLGGQRIAATVSRSKRLPD